LYKMNASINKTLLCDTILKENDERETFDEYDNINDLLKRWKNKKHEADRSRSENSFFVSAEEIKDNNYNLCFNEYRKVELPIQIKATAETPATFKKKSLALLTIKPKFNVDLFKTKLDFIRTKLDLSKIKFHLPRIKPESLKITFGLPPIKLDLAKTKLDLPKIKEGEPANLTLFDPNKEWTFSKENIKSKSKNSPFIGKKLKGKVVAVFNKNKYFLNV